MTRFYKRPILLIEFDPTKSFSLQVCKQNSTTDSIYFYINSCRLRFSDIFIRRGFQEFYGLSACSYSTIFTFILAMNNLFCELSVFVLRTLTE